MAKGHCGGWLQPPMSKPTAKRLPPGWSLGPILILVGSLAMALAPEGGRHGFGDTRDPGPRAIPVVLAMGLLGGGLAELVRTWLTRRRTPRAADRAARDGGTVPQEDRVEPMGETMVVLVLVVVYVAALPWLGFSLSTALFVVGLALRLGAHWATATATAVVLVVAVRLLFVVLFKVQLPIGQLGLPF